VQQGRAVVVVRLDATAEERVLREDLVAFGG
jgi:hypothetical protein